MTIESAGDQAPTGDAFKSQRDGQLAEDRMATLVRLLTFAQRNGIGRLELGLMVEELGLEEELLQLAAGDPERHRRVVETFKLLQLHAKLQKERADGA